MSQKTDKKQYGFDDFIRDAKRTGLTAAQLAEALVASEPMEASCVAAWEIMKEQEGLTIDLLNFRAIWLAGRAYGLQEQPSKIPASDFASSGAAAPLVDIRAEIAILEAIRLPKAEPTIAIQELLDGYLPDDRETHWEAIQAFADVHARSAVMLNTAAPQVPQAGAVGRASPFQRPPSPAMIEAVRAKLLAAGFEPIAANPNAAPAGTAVAHRVLRQTAQGEWVSDGRYWHDGAPDAELLKNVAEMTGQWQVQCAYATVGVHSTGESSALGEVRLQAGNNPDGLACLHFYGAGKLENFVGARFYLASADVNHQSDRDAEQIMTALREATDERELSFSAKEVRHLLNVWDAARHQAEEWKNRAESATEVRSVERRTLDQLRAAIRTNEHHDLVRFTIYEMREVLSGRDAMELGTKNVKRKLDAANHAAANVNGMLEEAALIAIKHSYTGGGIVAAAKIRALKVASTATEAGGAGNGLVDPQSRASAGTGVVLNSASPREQIQGTLDVGYLPKLPLGFVTVTEAGQPDHELRGLYLVIHKDHDLYPIALCRYGPEVDDEHNFVGHAWQEEVEDDEGNGNTYIRDVVAYLPVNLGYSGTEMVELRRLLKECQPAPSGGAEKGGS